MKSSEPISIFILGCRGAGKTSFLSGLSILSRPGYDSPFHLVSADSSTATTFADLRAMAERHEWPAPTSSLTPLDFELTYHEQRYKMSLLDYPGEDLLAAMETLSFDAKELILDHILQADCLLILTDPSQDLICQLNTNPPADSRRRQDALAQAAGYLLTHRHDSGKPYPLVAIGVSKSDIIESSDIDFESIVQQNEVLLRKLSKYARSGTTPECFAVTACGVLQDNVDKKPNSYPENPKPSGYEEIFIWVAKELFKRRNLKTFKAVALSVVVIIILACGFTVHKSRANSQLIDSITKSSLSDLPKIVNRYRSLSAEPLASLDERISSEITRIEERATTSSSSSQLLQIIADLNLLSSINLNPYQKEVSNLVSQINERHENAIFGALRSAERAGNTQMALSLAAEYESQHPSGTRITEVKEIINRIGASRERDLRSAVRGFPISNRDSLRRKSIAIKNYLDSYPNSPNATEIRDSLLLAERLASSNDVRIVFGAIRYSDTVPERIHYIRFTNKVSELPSLKYDSKSARRMSTFDNLQLDLSYTDWSDVTIHLEFEWKFFRHWSSPEVAKRTIHILRDLSYFDGRHHYYLENTGNSNYPSVGAWLTAEVQLKEAAGQWQSVSPNTLALYAKYIYPGTWW